MFVVIVVRLGYVQIVKADEYAAQALELQTREFVLSSDRGAIYDKNMKTLAVNQTGYIVWATPDDIRKAEKETPGYTKKLAKTLAGILEDLTETEIYEKLTSDSKTVKLEKYIDSEVYLKLREKIDDKTISAGIVTAETTRRYYPMGEFASHVIGITNEENTGIFGIELYYDQYLNGREGQLVTSTDASGRRLVTGIERYYPAEEGLSAVLTIDEIVQHYVENALKNGYKASNCLKAMAVVYDPKTGDILAMASYPDFDLNDPRTPIADREKDAMEQMTDEEKVTYWSGTMWRNPLVSDNYEPGSPFKLITTGIALEEGLTTLDDTFVCPGTMMVDGTPLSCWRSYAPHGTETLVQGVANSCNPVFMKLAFREGYDTFYKYLDLFGFTEKTGIDFPAEANSIIKNQKSVGKVELATMSYGQGIAVSMTQMIAALSSYGNDGKMMKPRLVSKLVDEDGEVVVDNEPTVVRQVVSAKTAADIRVGMEAVVSGGTGGSCNIAGYRIGGKTGTSNKPKSGKYSNDVWSSFFAMAPIDDPRVAVLVVVDEPQGQHSGNKVAGPITSEILRGLLSYMKISKSSRPGAPSPSMNNVKVPDVTGIPASQAKDVLKESGLNAIMCSSQKQYAVVSQYPAAGMTSSRGESVCLYAE